MTGTLNVTKLAGKVVHMSYTSGARMHEWQTTVFEAGLAGLTMDWGPHGTVEVRPVVDEAWARAVVDLFESEGWNTVAPYLRGLGFSG